ncbi:MAG: PAS domain S-box protein [Bacteroidetes bacterium]|jgi:PAS domain S-box-containing protein|nr:PAS domain S-box protein [Bacteroidota bacterium]
MAKITILVIDDKDDNLTAVKALLNSLEPDYEVLTAESGSEGIKKAVSQLPDTILLDIQMPNMDGLEVCRRLRAERKTARIPIIFLTAVKTSAKDRINGLAAGGDSYLTKPIDPAELLANLNAMLRIKKAEDSKLYQYKHIISSSTDLMALLDNNLIYLATNQAYLDAFDTSSDQVIGHTPQEIFGSQFFESHIKPNAVKCLSGETVKYAEWIDLPSKGKRYLEINYYPHYGENGQVEGIVVNARDVTVAKQTESELQRSEENLRTLFENSRDAIFISTMEGDLIYFNQAMTNLLGYSWDEMFAVNIAEIFTNPEDRYDFLETIKSKEYISDIEIMFSKHDGSTIDCILSATLQKDSNGEIIGYQGIIHDISERKRTERLNKVLFDITKASLSAPDLPDMIKSIKTVLQSVIDTTNFYVGLYDEQKQKIITPYASDMFDQIGSYPVGKSLTGYVIKTKKTFFANENSIVELHNKGKIEIFGTMPKLWLGVPLNVRKKVIGAIVVQS